MKRKVIYTQNAYIGLCDKSHANSSELNQMARKTYNMTGDSAVVQKDASNEFDTAIEAGQNPETVVPEVKTEKKSKKSKAPKPEGEAPKTEEKTEEPKPAKVPEKILATTDAGQALLDSHMDYVLPLFKAAKHFVDKAFRDSEKGSDEKVKLERAQNWLTSQMRPAGLTSPELAEQGKHIRDSNEPSTVLDAVLALVKSCKQTEKRDLAIEALEGVYKQYA